MFKVSFSKNEKYWCFASKNIPDFYAPTLLHEDLIPYDKKWERMWPKKLLYSLNELFQVFKEVGVNDINRQCIVAHKIVSLASLHCTEQ